MDKEFEAFVLYYTAWHEGEFTIRDMKKSLLEELGPEGLAKALHTFKDKRLEREAIGDKRTLYEAMKNG